MVHSSGVGLAVSTGKAVIYHSVPDVIDTRTEVWGGGFGRRVIDTRELVCGKYVRKEVVSFRHPDGDVRTGCVWGGEG